jgi:hypothetical protein
MIDEPNFAYEISLHIFSQTFVVFNVLKKLTKLVTLITHKKLGLIIY